MFINVFGVVLEISPLVRVGAEMIQGSTTSGLRPLGGP